MELKSETRVFSEVYGCPRCGGDHKDEFEEGKDGEKINVKLVFWPLTNPQEHEGALWAFCPETNEPIVVTQAQVEG